MKLKEEVVLQPVMGIQPRHRARAVLGKTSGTHASWVSSSSQQQLPHPTTEPLMGHTDMDTESPSAPPSHVLLSKNSTAPQTTAGLTNQDNIWVCAGSEESFWPYPQAGL